MVQFFKNAIVPVSLINKCKFDIIDCLNMSRSIFLVIIAMLRTEIYILFKPAIQATKNVVHYQFTHNKIVCAIISTTVIILNSKNALYTKVALSLLLKLSLRSRTPYGQLRHSRFQISVVISLLYRL